MLSYDTNEKRGDEQLSAVSSLQDSLVVPSSSRPASAAMTHASADSSLAPPSGLSKAGQFFDAQSPLRERVAVPACPVPGIPRNATEASTEPTEGQSADVPAPSGFHQALTGPFDSSVASHLLGASSIRKGVDPCQNFEEFASATTAGDCVRRIWAN